MNSKIKVLTLENSIYILLFLQIIIYLLIFGPLSINKIDLTINFYGDYPSYKLFDFSSLELILSQHRTFGFPLILKIYSFFDSNLTYWPKFVYILFSISNIFLYYSFKSFNFSKIFSFFFILGLTVSFNLYPYLTWWTELFSIIFLNITLGFMFLSINKDKIYYYLLFSFFLFFTYQIRPSFVIFSLLPVVFCLINYFLFKNSSKIKKIFFYSFTPLIVFIIIRFFIVGSLNFLSFSSGLAGNAVILLTEDQIPKLKIENQAVAKKFLERKRKLPYPCNLDLGQEQVSFYKHQQFGQYPCFNDYAMSSWLELIKINLNIEPFPKNDERNITAWEHVPTLANFWQKKEVVKKNVEIDRIMEKFAQDVYVLNYKKILKKFIKAPFYLMQIQRDLNGTLIIFYIILIIPVILFIKKSDIKSKNNNNEIALTLSFLIITIINILLLYIHQNGDPRAVVIQTYYLVPIFMSYLIFLIHRNLIEKIEL